MGVLCEVLEENGAVEVTFCIAMEVELNEHLELEGLAGDGIDFEFLQEGDEGRQVEDVAVAVAVGHLKV